MLEITINNILTEIITSKLELMTKELNLRNAYELIELDHLEKHYTNLKEKLKKEKGEQKENE